MKNEWLFDLVDRFLWFIMIYYLVPNSMDFLFFLHGRYPFLFFSFGDFGDRRSRPRSLSMVSAPPSQWFRHCLTPHHNCRKWVVWQRLRRLCCPDSILIYYTRSLLLLLSYAVSRIIHRILPTGCSHHAQRAGSAPPIAKISKKRKKGTDTFHKGRIQNPYYLVLSNKS